MIVVTVLTGRCISTTAPHSTVEPLRRNVATSEPGAFSCPPAQTNPVQVMRSVSPVSAAVVRDASRPYVFSSVKTRNPNRSPPNATDGSGKSKLNFMNACPRGGTNTSLVDVSGSTSAAFATEPASGAARGAITPAASAVPETMLAAPTTPTTLSQSRREISEVGTTSRGVSVSRLPSPVSRVLMRGRRSSTPHSAHRTTGRAARACGLSADRPCGTPVSSRPRGPPSSRRRQTTPGSPASMEARDP